MVFNETAKYGFILLRKQGYTQLIYSTEHLETRAANVSDLVQSDQ